MNSIKYIIIVTVCLLLILSSKEGMTQNNDSLFLDLSLEKPENLPQFTADDFKVDLNRLTLYPNGFILSDKEALSKLGDFFIKNDNGEQLWKRISSNAADVLNRWDFRRWEANRGYIYYTPQLQDLAVVYLFTGHELLGKFLHDHVMQITNLSKRFWLHYELRKGNYLKNKGSLETSYLCISLPVVLTAAAQIFTEQEIKDVESSLYEKGLEPCLNWLKTPNANNWTAVVGTGAFVASKYFNSSEGIDLTLKTLSAYINNSVEDDGSYGEGVGYFTYPIGYILPALLSMDRQERTELFKDSSLKRTPEWLAYPFLYSKGTRGRGGSIMLHFGDNSYRGPSSFSMYQTLAYVSKDPLANWLKNKFARSPDIYENLFLFATEEESVGTQSPQQRDLSLIRTFDSGDCFMRSSWDENGIVLATRSGEGSRIRYSHQRPELGSITMGAYGEYLVISPGAASYRSPIHYQWDRTTRAANIITIDEKNQLFPGKGGNSWIKSDVSQFWMSGMPKAKITKQKQGVLADIMVNDLAAAYHVPLNNFKRAMLFIKDPGYFVIIDKIDAMDGPHKYSWRIHLNNRDEKGELTDRGEGSWFFTRPNADLEIRIFADQSLGTKVGEGYMHGADRDYSPGGIFEGKLGSSIELEAFNVKENESITYFSVLFPLEKGDAVPDIQFKDNAITIGADKLEFSKGICQLTKGDRSEKFKIYEE